MGTTKENCLCEQKVQFKEFCDGGCVVHAYKISIGILAVNCAVDHDVSLLTGC